jgi:hypothetical protein
MIVWLVGLVGGFKMPLPPTCPMEFSTMPEHFVEDAMELLIFASRIPKALDGVVLVDFTSNNYFYLSFISQILLIEGYAFIFLFSRMSL